MAFDFAYDVQEGIVQGHPVKTQQRRDRVSVLLSAHAPATHLFAVSSQYIEVVGKAAAGDGRVATL